MYIYIHIQSWQSSPTILSDWPWLTEVFEETRHRRPWTVDPQSVFPHQLTRKFGGKALLVDDELGDLSIIYRGLSINIWGYFSG